MKRQVTNAQVLAIKTPGRHSLGGNLFLLVRKTPAGTLSRGWTFKFEKDGVTHEMGLGSLLRVSPAKARLKAATLRLVLDEGGNPWVPKAPPGPAPETLRTHAKAYIESKGAGWTTKHRAQWVKAVGDYLSPIADKPIAVIDTALVVDCLRPLWDRIPATGAKVRGMLEQILASATSLGLRSGQNPAVWKGHLENILHKDKGEQAHHAAMDYSDVPDFVQSLRACSLTASLALEFAILTACRSGEIRGAKWDEFDLESKVWTIPANWMKADREHRVPLCDRCAAIIESLAAGHSGDFVFTGTQAGKPIGKMAMSDLVAPPATVHGMRSSFADWAGEETTARRETIERALAHVVGNGTEQAYRRGDEFKHRRELMIAWADFCEYGSKKVVPIRA